MGKKNDPNNFKFPTTIKSDTFTDFLAASLETERLLPVDKPHSPDQSNPKSDRVPTIDSIPLVSSHEKEVNIIEAKLPDRVESLSDDTITHNSTAVSSFTNLSQYANCIVNDPSILSGRSKRFRMADESHTTIKVIHQSLVQHGVFITMPRLLDFIIQGHAETITHLIKSLKKRSARSKR